MWRARRVDQDLQAPPVKTAAPDEPDYPESLVFPDKTEEKDPGDPWALKVGESSLFLWVLGGFSD